ncbi:MAG: PQQ-binding-like beta-propeller repeat protein [Verrucomicrobia bacterium]|nr:PQQ-binding-like beta-propeller repeat protein [Verrucomicrobiota bacterium]
MGRLVEGGLGCNGLLDNVRISRGVRDIVGVQERPFEKDAATLGLWNFDELTAATGKPDYWSVENAEERAALPEFRVIPAALPSQLTPANGFPKRETFLTWHRSHGDNGGTRYSALDQISRQNITNLQVAWTYHSRDGSNAIQCNPIIVNGVMFAPTAGRHLVAVNAATGEELWRFKPAGRPAFRGLIYWPGGNGAGERVMFCAGKFLYALDPMSGQPIKSFGQDGKATLPGVSSDHFGAATAGPTIFERTLVVPGFEKDVWAFDVITGEQRWTFHTVPQPGEFGFDTWGQTETYGANCWSGMAMDEQRGIAYITTGSPKKNFIGVGNPGDNLFGNCVIALDARTGQRLWHFQEIRHDIWDLDIPSPPNLTTITHEGKRVDVVAVVTKIANTILLDRVTGKPIFPFRLRRAPTSDLRGETTSPYQPDPELPERFSKKEFTAADLTDRTEEAADFALTRFKSATTGWFRPGSEGRANLFFNIDGGAEWTGACVDPDTGHLYVTANHMGWLISIFRNDDPPDDPKTPRTRGLTVFETTCASCHGTNRLGIGVAPPLRGVRHRLTDEQVTNQIRTGRNGMPAVPEAQLSEQDLKALLDYVMLRDRPMPAKTAPPERPVYSFTGYPRFVDHEGYPANKPPWGTLNCLDLNSGKLLWKVPLGEFPALTAQGVPKTGTENYGGAIVTAGGLVFCAGTIDSKIRAFDKVTGEEVWSAKLPWVGNAPPATYQIDGRQYIVIASTGSKLGTSFGDAYVAFALPPAKQ